MEEAANKTSGHLGTATELSPVAEDLAHRLSVTIYQEITHLKYRSHGLLSILFSIGDGSPQLRRRRVDECESRLSELASLVERYAGGLLSVSSFFALILVQPALISLRRVCRMISYSSSAPTASSTASSVLGAYQLVLIASSSHRFCLQYPQTPSTGWTGRRRLLRHRVELAILLFIPNEACFSDPH